MTFTTLFAVLLVFFAQVGDCMDQARGPDVHHNQIISVTVPQMETLNEVLNVLNGVKVRREDLEEAVRQTKMLVLGRRGKIINSFLINDAIHRAYEELMAKEMIDMLMTEQLFTTERLAAISRLLVISSNGVTFKKVIVTSNLYPVQVTNGQTEIAYDAGKLGLSMTNQRVEGKIRLMNEFQEKDGLYEALSFFKEVQKHYPDGQKRIELEQQWAEHGMVFPPMI